MDAVDLAIRGVMDIAGINQGTQGIISSLLSVDAATGGLTSKFGLLGTAAGAGLAAVAAGAIAAGAAMAKAVSDAAAWESALTRVAKTTGIEKDSSAYNSLSNNLQDLRMQAGISREEAASAAELAGSVGIGQEFANMAQQATSVEAANAAWDKYTETISEASLQATQMAGAFGMSTGEVMESMGQLGSTTRQKGQSWSDFFKREGSVIDEMGNSLATSESKITSGMLHASSAFALYKPTDEVLYKWTALMGTMQSVGFANAGEGIKDLMNYMMRPELSGSASKMLGLTPEQFQAEMQKDAPEMISQVAAMYKNLDAAGKAELDKASGDTGRKVWQYLQSDDVRKMYDESKEKALRAGSEGTGLEKSFDKSMAGLEAQASRTSQIIQTTFEKAGTDSLGPLTESVKKVNTELQNMQPMLVNIISDFVKLGAAGISAGVDLAKGIYDGLQSSGQFLGEGILKLMGIDPKDLDGKKNSGDGVPDVESTLSHAKIMEKMAGTDATSYTDTMGALLETDIPLAISDAYLAAGGVVTPVVTQTAGEIAEAWANGFQTRLKANLEKGMSKEFAEIGAAYIGNAAEMDAKAFNAATLASINMIQDSMKANEKTAIGGGKYNWGVESEVGLTMSWLSKGGNTSHLKLFVGDKEYDELLGLGDHATDARDRLFERAAADLGRDLTADFGLAERLLTGGEIDQKTYENLITLNAGGIQFNIDSEESATNFKAGIAEAMQSALAGGVDEAGIRSINELMQQYGKSAGADPEIMAIWGRVQEAARNYADDTYLITKIGDEKVKQELRDTMAEDLTIIDNGMSEIAARMSSRWDGIVVDSEKFGQSIKDTLANAVAEAQKSVDETGFIPDSWVNEQIALLEDLKVNFPDTFKAIGGDSALAMLEGFRDGSVGWGVVAAALGKEVGASFKSALLGEMQYAAGPTLKDVIANPALLSQITDQSMWMENTFLPGLKNDMAEMNKIYSQGYEGGEKLAVEYVAGLQKIYSEHSSWFKDWQASLLQLYNSGEINLKTFMQTWDAFQNDTAKKTDEATKKMGLGYDNLKKTIEDCADCVMSDFGKWQEAQDDLFSPSWITGSDNLEEYVAQKTDYIRNVRETQEAMAKLGGVSVGKSYLGEEYDWVDEPQEIKITADKTDFDAKCASAKSLIDEVGKLCNPVTIAANADPFFATLQAVYNSITPIVIPVYYDDGGYMPTQSNVDWSINSPGSPSASDVFGVYASGTSYVPRTGPYILHEGEAVVTAEENRQGGRGNVTYAPSHTFILGKGGSGVTEARIRQILEEDRAAFKKDIIKGTS